MVKAPLLLFSVATVAVAGCHRAALSTGPRAVAPSPLAADIDTLASPAFSGRAAGTHGADSAADFLARRYYHLGLRAAFESECTPASRCATSYLQMIRLPDVVYHNVGAIVDGLDSARRGEYVVIGAHFDHLGHSPSLALDRSAGFVLRPGADDNASGTAAVLELARRFADRPAKRSILFVNFDAEEQGLVGSRALLITPPVAKTAICFMLNFDMIGRMRGDRLFVDSRSMEPAVRAVFDSSAKTVGIRAQFVPNEGHSDDASFADEGIVAAGLSTGLHADYHKASDVPTRLNITGLRRVVDLAESVVRRMADR